MLAFKDYDGCQGYAYAADKDREGAQVGQHLINEARD